MIISYSENLPSLFLNSSLPILNLRTRTILLEVNMYKIDPKFNHNDYVNSVKDAIDR